MSAANYATMRDFSLFAKSFFTTGKRCLVCGTIQPMENEICDVCDCDDLEEYTYFDEFECSCVTDEIAALLDDLNRDLLFHKVELRSGYYYGVQFYVETEHDLTAYEYDNDECHYYFDLCRSAAYRKYAAEIRKINRSMKKIAQEYGFEELVCVARFSNGEAVFSPASNPRAGLLAAVAG